MGYRIVEMTRRVPGSLENATEVGVYDSAYEAMAVMKRAFIENGVPPRWYLVDTTGQILARPEDIYDTV